MDLMEYKREKDIWSFNKATNDPDNSVYVHFRFTKRRQRGLMSVTIHLGIPGNADWHVRIKVSHDYNLDELFAFLVQYVKPP